MFTLKSLVSYSIGLVSTTILITSTHAKATEPPNDNSTENWVQYYNSRYNLPDIFSKLVDNHGDGFAELYGTRNFRKLFGGALYRGGANNTYNKANPRSNQNPLQENALANLCKEGFSTAIYLYATNYKSAPHQIHCNSVRETNHTLDYKQISPTDTQGLKEILSLILANIRNPQMGPTYIHCWNGWHASGLVSAASLKQFCGWSNNDAENYWDRNTDGNNGSQYNSIRKRVRNFVPYPELSMTQAEQEIYCP